MEGGGQRLDRRDKVKNQDTAGKGLTQGVMRSSNSDSSKKWHVKRHSL